MKVPSRFLVGKKHLPEFILGSQGEIGELTSEMLYPLHSASSTCAQTHIHISHTFTHVVITNCSMNLKRL